MKSLAALPLAVLCALAIGCSGGSGGPPHPVGASTFTSPPPQAGGLRGGVVTAAGGAVPSADGPAGAAGAQSPSRAIEEADIYRRVGSTLLLLNAYRGLQIADIADPGTPRLLSRVPVLGTPVDLYVRGSVALVVVSDYFYWLPTADGTGTRPGRGSRVVAVDFADPAHPTVVGDIHVDGEVSQTRIVGDILYVFSRRWWWYDWVGDSPPAVPTDTVFVASLDVSDPAHLRAVDRLELPLPGSGWSSHANVTTERATLFFAGWELGDQGSWGPVTRFQVIDISDPAGALAGGAAFATAGMVADRWGMDFDAASGTFRAVLARGWNGGADLAIWSSPSPGSAVPLSRLSVDVPESLTAARFDGGRVYLVTARTVDPLWAVDASDPAHPRIAGQLHMPGQLDFIEPRGDRLVALGHTSEAGQPFQLAASLIDVADLASPKLLSRAVFGSSWSWLAVTADDLRKAFLVFDPPPDGIGLILVPLQGWDQATYRYVGGTQLVDYGRDALAARGFLAHPGSVTRAFPVDAAGQRLVAMSDQALQTIDATDRSAPRELARLDLARPVSAIEVLGEYAVELAGDWYRGGVELAVTGALDPDAAAPLARLAVGAPSARMLRDGQVIWLLAHDWSTGKGFLQGVDFADPVHPVLRGRLELDPGDAASPMPCRWGWGDEAVLVGHALVLHRYEWFWLDGPGAGTSSRATLKILDLSDPDAPALASTVVIPGADWAWGLTATGGYAWLTHYEWRGSVAGGSYYVDRIDVADPRAPVVLDGINVPGIFVAASGDGRRIYTVETIYDTAVSTPTYSWTSWMHGLELDPDGKARLYGSARLPGYPSGTAVGDAFAWASTYDWSSAGTTARLLAVDLSDMSVRSDQGLHGDWVWLARAAAGKLFLQIGWGADQGILVYDLADPGRPGFEKLARTSGWVFDIVVAGGFAYLPSGPYGVPMIPLAP